MENNTPHLKVHNSEESIYGNYKLVTYQNSEVINSEPVHISSKEEFKTVLENIKLFNNENSEKQQYQRLTITD